MEKIFDIALVFSPHEWVEALHRHCTNTGELRIRSLVYDPTVLKAETFDACVISDSHPALSAGLVQQLHSSGHSVIGVCDDTADAQSFLASLEVDGIFSSRSSARELALSIQEFLATIRDTSKNDFHEMDDPIATTNEDEHTGVTFGVLGSGGVGTTEVALALSSRLVDAVVVDTDFEHPSLAPRTGLDITPHIIDALESAHNGDDQFTDNAQRLPHCSAIVGVSHASFARDIRNYEIDSLHNALTRSYTHSVFDLGRYSEDSSFYTHTSSIIEKCDALVLVGEPTPVGILRLLEQLALLQSSNHTRRLPPVTVVMNKCIKNRSMKIDIEQELGTLENVQHFIFLPYTRDLVEDAWRSNTTLPSSWKKPMDDLLHFLHQHNNATILNYEPKDEVLLDDVSIEVPA